MDTRAVKLNQKLVDQIALNHRRKKPRKVVRPFCVGTDEVPGVEEIIAEIKAFQEMGYEYILFLNDFNEKADEKLDVKVQPEHVNVEAYNKFLENYAEALKLLEPHQIIRSSEWRKLQVWQDAFKDHQAYSYAPQNKAATDKFLTEAKNGRKNKLNVDIHVQKEAADILSWHYKTEVKERAVSSKEEVPQFIDVLFYPNAIPSIMAHVYNAPRLFGNYETSFMHYPKKKTQLYELESSSPVEIPQIPRTPRSEISDRSNTKDLNNSPEFSRERRRSPSSSEGEEIPYKQSPKNQKALLTEKESDRFLDSLAVTLEFNLPPRMAVGAYARAIPPDYLRAACAELTALQNSEELTPKKPTPHAGLNKYNSRVTPLNNSSPSAHSSPSAQRKPGVHTSGMFSLSTPPVKKNPVEVPQIPQPEATATAGSALGSVVALGMYSVNKSAVEVPQIPQIPKVDITPDIALGITNKIN